MGRRDDGTACAWGMWWRRKLRDETLQDLAAVAFQRAMRERSFWTREAARDRVVELVYETAGGVERLGRAQRRKLERLAAAYGALLERGRLI